MVMGLQGSGKTTFCGKLALKLKNEGRSPMLVAADIYRPAAIDQLHVIGDASACRCTATASAATPRRSSSWASAAPATTSATC